jgi:hypothetical protein
MGPWVQGLRYKAFKGERVYPFAPPVQEKNRGNSGSWGKNTIRYWKTKKIGL